MSYIKKREVTLVQRIMLSPFAKLNNEVYSGISKLLGPSKSAENHLLADDDFLSAVMPTIIGLSPNSGGWQKAVNNYLYAFSVDIPKGGKNLNTSLIFDLSDSKKKDNILKTQKQFNVKFADDKDFGEYVTTYDKKGNKRFNEMDILKVATPENPLDYFVYVYCLYHNRVANKQEYVNKSPRIEYYLITKEDIQDAKRKKYEIVKKITTILLKIEENPVMFDNVCSILNITEGDRIDKAIALNELAKDKPQRIIEVYNDKNITTKALIENYIRTGILKRIPGSSLITDAADSSLIIGNTMDGAITFFNNKTNEVLLNQYAMKYKSMISSKQKEEVVESSK